MNVIEDLKKNLEFRPDRRAIEEDIATILVGSLMSPLRGNGIFRAEIKRPKRPWRFKDVGAETKSR
jgi:hypothetical protein